MLITAGPTYEPIDPVRFIGNHSSGKMGFALSDAFLRAGANVWLIAGPTQINPEFIPERFIRVTTAKEMYQESIQLFPHCDIAILAAAVADYRPVRPESKKIRSAAPELVIKLEKTEDIAEALGKLKNEGQIIVGFALETHNEKEHAKEKLRKKNFDFIVLNSLRDPGSGFGHDTNLITIIDADFNTLTYKLKHKLDVALDILDVIAKKLQD